MNQQEIEAYNERELWRDAENHLRVAHESIEQARGCLEDLHKEHLAENLKPLQESIDRFICLAEDRADGEEA